MVFEQDLVPKKAAGILGLDPGSKIIIFAGGAGDWAHCLAADGLQVRYTDKSQEVVARVREKFQDPAFEIAQADAFQLPREDTGAFLVSFEPIPMYGPGFDRFFKRALVHSAGLIIIQRGYMHPNPEGAFRQLAGLCGIESSIAHRFFMCRRPGKKRFAKTPLVVYFAKAEGRAKLQFRKLLEG